MAAGENHNQSAWQPELLYVDSEGRRMMSRRNKKRSMVPAVLDGRTDQKRWQRMKTAR
jgi:hypothetical protein